MGDPIVVSADLEKGEITVMTGEHVDLEYFDSIVPDRALDQVRYIRENFTEGSPESATLLTEADRTLSGERSAEFYLGFVAGVGSANMKLAGHPLMNFLGPYLQKVTALLGAAIRKYDEARAREGGPSD